MLLFGRCGGGAETGRVKARELFVGSDNSGSLDFLEFGPDHEREYQGGPAELTAALRWFLGA